MKTKYYGFALLLLIPFLSVQIGCKKDKDPAKPLIFVTPDALQLFAEVGKVISFDISISSEAGLSSFMVESKIYNGTSFTVTEFETSISGSGTYNKLYEIMAPQAAGGSSVIYTFTATDVDGQQSTSLKRVWVTATSTPLVETSGHVMYNSNSQNANAYNVKIGLPVISQFSTDSLELDIQDFPVDSSTTVLSRSWISPAGGKFVRFNSFDYANATDSSAAQAFNTGIPLPQVNNLAELDIILLQLADTAQSAAPQIAVIQITGINNVDTTTSLDSYIFNIKK